MKVRKNVNSGDDVAPADVPPADVVAEVGDRPKLPKGFYEVETVRNKRFQKGKIHYLVKWRDWPESANTWEPKENLRAVSDIIDAYEQSLRSAKQNIAKKGKRKSTATQSQPKKKQKKEEASPSAATYDVPTVKIKIRKNPIPMAPLDNFNSPAAEEVESEEREIIGVAVPTQPIGNGVGTVPAQNDVSVLGITENIATQEGKESVGLQELPKADDVAQGPSSLRIGSRRRKSSSVKKFTLSSDSGEPVVVAHTNGLANAVNGGGFNSKHKNKSQFPSNRPTIKEIVKPVSLSTSVVNNNTHDVSVTFTALRSDGKEVTVDNKYLKVNNPLLLINFYEEHLRYNELKEIGKDLAYAVSRVG